MNIPLAIPLIGEEEEKAVLEVLRSGWLTHGPYNTKFEEEFAEYIGVRHAVSMNSCTSALEAALKAYDIKGEVIVPSFTFVASANSIVTSGAIPVFSDVDPATRNVTAAHIREVLTDATEAVMIVHYAGQCCPMDDIISLCEEKGLLLIEDSAENIGGTWKGAKAGSFGVGCYSFFPTKNMTTGEGGMLTLNDSEAFARAKELLGHGIPSKTMDREKQGLPWERSAVRAGHNYRLNNLLACIGYHQLHKLDAMNARRKEIAAMYDRGISEMKLPVKVPAVQDEAEHVYQMYTVEAAPEHRDQWVFALREQGVGASVHFAPPVHMQDFYRDNFPPRVPLPNSEYLAGALISLPIYPSMSDAEAEYVLEAMKKVMG